MAGDEVYMDVEAVQNISKGFGTAADTFKTISQGLEVAIDILSATAFFGMIGNAALAMYLNNIKPNVDKLAAKCEEMSGDIGAAIVAYQTGDTSGSKRFQ